MGRLLQKASAGDDDAFAELFQEHTQMLWKTAMSVLRNEDKAADALQETAIKAWRSLPSFDGKCKLATWLVRILLNTCYDEIRAAKKVVSMAEIGEDQIPLNLQSEPGTNSLDTHIDIGLAVQKLNLDDRLILTLFYTNDLPICDVAEALEITEGAARTRLVRARHRFKKIYTEKSEQKPIAPILAGVAI